MIYQPQIKNIHSPIIVTIIRANFPINKNQHLCDMKKKCSKQFIEFSLPFLIDIQLWKFSSVDSLPRVKSIDSLVRLNFGHPQSVSFQRY